MNVILTVKTKDEIKYGKRVVEFADKVFVLDFSLNAQMRWEKRFPEQAKNEELVLYAERMEKAEMHLKNGAVSLATLTAKMKVLYCYFDTDLTFIEFVALFDLSKKEYANKIIEQIKLAFEIITNEAVEKN